MTQFIESIAFAACLVLPVTGCKSSASFPDKATRYYPMELHSSDNIVPVQVFRDGMRIEIVNSTSRSFTDFDVWLNQRYVTHVEQMSAGQSLQLRLSEFYDVLGERPNPGGFWRVDPATPMQLVELQVSDDEPLIGLIAVGESSN